MKSEQNLLGGASHDQLGSSDLLGQKVSHIHAQFSGTADILRRAPKKESQQDGIGMYIETYTGRKFNALLPTPDSVHIKDIAHALSMTCRFAGMGNAFYSVAEHSVVVADRLPDKYKLWGLLHDAAEAYIGDMPSPFKSLFSNYKEIEANILRVIVAKYGLDPEEPEAVKVVDRRLLHTEARFLIPECSWLDTSKVYQDVKIMALPPAKAEELFLFAFSNLYKTTQ